MTDEPALRDRATELRRAFDDSFARAALSGATETVDLLAVRVGAKVYAMRLDAVAGLHVGVPVAACPSPMPELLGIANWRGALFAVHDLAALLGEGRGDSGWLARIRGEALGFAFAGFVGHVRLDPTAFLTRGERGDHVTAIARTERGDWPVLDVPSLIASIRSRLPRSSKERP